MKYYVVGPSIWNSIQSRMWRNPVERFDAVNKAYVDRTKFKSATGTIPNTVLTDHILFTFPEAKGFISRKTIIGEMWVERLLEEWTSTSSPMFATEWPGFRKFTRDLSLMRFFSDSPASRWTRNFRLRSVELPWISLNYYNHSMIMLLIMLKW